MTKPKNVQKMARINVDPDAWTALRVEALHRHVSLADYLGLLIGREAERLARRNAKRAATRDQEPGPAERPADRRERRAIEAIDKAARATPGGPDDDGHWEPPTDLDDDLDGLPLDRDWSRFLFDPPNGKRIQIPPWEV